MKLIFRILLLLMPTILFAQDWQMKQAPLMTAFAKDVDPANVLPEYPRPQLVRDAWMNLNGIWQFQPGTNMNEKIPVGELARKILVPYPVESAISGVMEHHEILWYRRTFTVPENWSGQNVIIHFGAVDYISQVVVNGKTVGIHQGGYDSFSFDITDFLTNSGEQVIMVRAYDPTDEKGIPRGKQTLHPGGIMYTSATGIWQTVWLEPVPKTYISNIKMVPDIDNQVIKLTVNTVGKSDNLSISAIVKDGNKSVQNKTGNANQEISIKVPNAKLWSPDSPFLYDLELKLEKNGEVIDLVDSYFGMRKISMVEDKGIQKLYLNNEFLFHQGPLDQGFWPDGIYTAPTDEALRFDIEMMKELGFNMVRKHIKVEPQRWYYWADKLGLMVWQDMPSANSYTSNPKPIDVIAYERELTKMVETHLNSPSIVMWVVFNEGQGQHNTPELVNLVAQLDPTRMINQASGGGHHNVGHILDYHSYPPPVCPRSSTQVLACGEFGGIGYEISDHLWNDDDIFQYVAAANEEEYLSMYEDFMDQVTIFKTNRGMSAAVYTEITDVEIELNGILTYDRIPKADIGRIRAANQKVIKQDLFLQEVVPSSEETGLNWKYTTQKPSYNWYSTSYSDAIWKTGQGGFGTELTPGAVVRTVWDTEDIWLRREFSIDNLSEVNLEDLMLYIHHDEECEVYINGVPAAKIDGYSSRYVMVPIFDAAKKTLKEGEGNLIAIHCSQTYGGQYIDAGFSILSLVDNSISTNSSKNSIEKKKVILFPSPADEVIQFSKPFDNIVSATIVNMNGAIVKSVKGKLHTIDVSDLSSGIYLMQVNETTEINSYRFIKK